MRGKKVKKIDIKPDPKYGRVDVAKFINYLMEAGKKTVAQDIFYSAMDIITEKTKKNPVDIFNEAILSIQPQVEVRSKRVGGANYQVPLPVRGTRQYALACRWMITAAREMKGRPMAEKLSQVILETHEGTGAAIKRRDEVHRMAEANKAFAHFARFAK